MPRTSRAVAEQHRQKVIESTSRLIREKGADQVSVPEAMAAAGLTHGGFYRHFSSKEDLVAQALTAAFAERREAMDQLAAPDSGPAGKPLQHTGPQAAPEAGPQTAPETGDGANTGGSPPHRSPRATFLARYLSTIHRDHPDQGCAAAALAADAARAEPGTPVRAAYTSGLRELVDGFQRLPDGEGDTATDRDTALAELSTLVGAILLARASDDAALSREILDAAHRRLTDPVADSPA